MAYFLEALILRRAPDAVALPGGARLVTLPQNLWLLPITDEVIAAAEARTPGTRLTNLPPAVEAWAVNFSANDTIAYVEAEFFGGAGNQCCVVWSNGAPVLGPLCQTDAINLALRALGVQAGGNKDEFDTIELGRHRHTDNWK